MGKNQQALQRSEITGEENKKIPEEGIVYIFGINDKKETYQTNIEEVGELKFKGDKPSSGTITLTKDKKVVVQNLVSKNKKWCAKKDGNTKNVTVGKATELGCAIEEEKEEIVKDKKTCELEEETKDGKTYYYVDSVCDLYALSKNVSSGTNYSGKIVKLRNNLDMSKIDNNTKKYIEENKDYFTEEDLKINERFMPIGTSAKVFAGTFEGNAKTISNLTINRPTMTYVGLFGYLNKGTIEGVTINNLTINGNSYVGGIAGYNAGTIKGINLTEIKLTSPNNILGGITGYNAGTIKEVVVRGDLVGDDKSDNRGIGGVAGAGSTNTITSALVNINITAYPNYVFGICGSEVFTSGTIIESGTINGGTGAAYYSDKVVATYYNGTKYDSNALGNINGYESAIDTYIGGDDDDSGYYFDYDKSGKLVIKSTEKDPIEFKLKGSGTESDPYLIGSYEDWKMATIKADQVGAYFKITKDIDFTGKRFYMLGSYQNKFSGTLDGDNHTLTGIETKGGSYQGIIGYMDSADAVVKNLKINKASMTNLTSYSGIVVGYLNKGTIKDVEVTNSKIISEFKDIASYIGGITGYLNKGTIEGVTINNLTINGNSYVGGIAGYNAGTIKGINLTEIKLTSPNNILGGITGYNAGTIKEVVVRGDLVGDDKSDNRGIGGVAGAGSTNTITSALVNINITAYPNYVFGICGSEVFTSGTIIESGTINGGTGAAYYSDKVVATYYNGTKYSSNYINDLTYYDGLLDSSNKPIIESKYTGDVNGSGYFFDYGSDGKIRVVKAYAYDKGTADVDENYTMTKIVGTTDTTAPECTLDYVVPVSNGIRASFSCTDESGAPSITSMFDSTTSLAAKEYENIGTDKKGIVSGNTRSIVSTWTTNDPVSVPTKGKCYYFRYGGKDSSGNYSTYVTKSCYKGFN